MAIAGSTTAQIHPPPEQVAAGPAAAMPPSIADGLPPPAGVSVVPTEAVLLLAVEMPAMTAAQRRAAVAFAVEDRIAQPLEEVQVALGPQLSAGTWLVAVTARSVLAGIARKATDHVLWPDVFLIPVPVAGWAVWSGADRAVVRLPDGTGFAAPLAVLPAFWAAAGSPAITLFGDAMPATITVAITVAARAVLPPAPDPALAGFDLRAGGQRAGGQLSRLKAARPLAAVLLAAALGHLGLAGLDVMALHRLAQDRAADLHNVLRAQDGTNLDTAIAQALAARQPADSAGVLALLSRAFGAIAAEAGRVTVQDLRYSMADKAAVLSLEAPDLVSLQAIETALSQAGLGVSAGAASSDDGAAEVRMTIREGGA